jgi:adenine-specific DNA-methyltransferase
MTPRNQKLELTWIGKENRPRLEPRILLEEPARSYHAAHRVSEDDLFDNRLIFGDNLLALKALEQEFAGKVKCVYIDPPFNTGEAFEHYDDGLEHSIWLSLMRDRLELIWRLLSSDGSLFVHIDDNELAYLTVLLDEIFGRENRVSIITFKQGAATGHKAINPGIVSTSNFLVLFARDKSKWNPHKVFTARPNRDKRYNQFVFERDRHPSEWRFDTLLNVFVKSLGKHSLSEAKKALGKDFEQSVSDFVYRHPRSVIRMARPSYDAVSSAARELIDLSKQKPDEIFLLHRDDYSDMYFRSGERILFYSDKLKEVDGELVAGDPLTSIWDDLLSNNLHNEGGVKFPKGKKPEALLKRVLDLATDPGDWVLDSFAGSGTTGAVAHKMGRRWIMLELGEHILTHIIPRMKSVINGEDTSGVTKAASWQGGGGFRYYRLAPSLLEKDRWGHWVINKSYNPEMLAEAACKLEGFTYAPSDLHYWQHGYSTEQDFLYVTTQTLTHEQLQALSEEVGAERSLLVLCAAWRGVAEDAYSNLTIKKIPQAVLHRCEYGHDDYSLRVENLPAAPVAPPSRPVQRADVVDGEDGEADEDLHQLGLFVPKP